LKARLQRAVSKPGFNNYLAESRCRKSFLSRIPSQRPLENGSQIRGLFT
jgi:hypothetical protein